MGLAGKIKSKTGTHSYISGVTRIDDEFRAPIKLLD
jgi:hypothetical protein